MHCCKKVFWEIPLFPKHPPRKGVISFTRASCNCDRWEVKILQHEVSVCTCRKTHTPLEDARGHRHIIVTTTGRDLGDFWCVRGVSTDRNNSVKMVSRVRPPFQHVRPGNYRLKESWLLERVYICLLFSMVSLCVCTAGEHGCEPMREISVSVSAQCILAQDQIIAFYYKLVLLFQVKHSGLYHSHMRKSAAISHKRLNSCSFN